ncbi:hypothetical protein EDD16DRAFT_1602482, partial [Pisolithus croceorrhizus]
TSGDSHGCQGGCHRSIKLPTSSCPPQLTVLEEALMESIQILKLQKRILGPLPTLDEILDPKEEQEIGEFQYQFEGGDAEIVAVVQCELAHSDVQNTGGGLHGSK